MTHDLTEEEILFLSNRSLIDEKLRLYEVVREALEEQARILESDFSSIFPTSPPAKVSKGENLLGYPYLVLDYPRLFGQEDIMAFRILFWWGHFVSACLHLKGEPLLKIKTKVIELLEKDQLKNVYLSYSGDEWNHDVRSSDYQLSTNSLAEQLEAKDLPFLKLSVLLPLSEINNLEQFVKKASHQLLKITT